jgi:hypothetical protein
VYLYFSKKMGDHIQAALNYIKGAKPRADPRLREIIENCLNRLYRRGHVVIFTDGYYRTCYKLEHKEYRGVTRKKPEYTLIHLKTYARDTLIHELLHVGGADEREAYYYTSLIAP